jgi:hypothetical protein
MRFIDGLRDDLKAVVLIQPPTNLDTAIVLAQLQDEVSPSARRKEFRRTEFSYSQKPLGGYLLPPPPPKIDKPPGSVAEDRRACSCTVL